MSRKHLTRAQAVRIFDAAGGICHVCRTPIRTGQQWHIDHRKPLWLGGADDESNMMAVHTACHLSKTAIEAGVRAKVIRTRAKHLGVKKPQARPMPGTRASKWKRKFYGEWVLRRK